MRKRAGATEDRLDIRIAEVVSDVTHDMGEAAALEKDGVERDLQEALAAAPENCGEGFRLVRREWPTDIGPVDLMCRDAEDGWVAVEIKRVATIEAVEQLTPLPRAHPARPGDGRRAAACSPRSRSSRRRACWPSRAGSRASRSTSRCCAASASPSSRCSRRSAAHGPRAAAGCAVAAATGTGAATGARAASRGAPASWPPAHSAAHT